ncbi:hypothetical protein POM88_033905 [Heracleum sosnowskyi]|uniref:Ferritin/DPS domain-containing protein n=1 Tax=Heracleum sosnowskyi TaxID=360622 RepID=A0AAD8HK87_9APIA|nr:hypothetical protein POM88_033905 [Heracleum sosnowskyi]
MWTSFDVRYFGIPSSGKTTFLLALAGKLDSSLKGIPEQAVAPIVAQAPAGGQAVAPVVAQAPAGGQAVNPPSQPQAPQTTVPHGGPNANPLNLFPQIKFAIQYMRRSILKKAKFDIEELNTIKVAKSSFVPVLFGHAIDDDFIQPHHSDRIFDAYVGDKNIIKFDAMELALSLEKMTNEKLLHLHEVASRNNDVQLADFVESEFLTEQVKAIKKMFEYVAQLRRVGKGHGVWHFNQMLFDGAAA